MSVLKVGILIFQIFFLSQKFKTPSEKIGIRSAELEPIQTKNLALCRAAYTVDS